MSLILSVLETASHLVTELPNPEPQAPPGMDNFKLILGWIKWGALVACIVGVMIAGAMVAIGNSRGGGASEHLPKVLWAILGALIISASTWLINMFI